MNNKEASKVAGVIAAVGTDNLGQSLCAMLESDVRFDMSCAYVFRFDRTAVLLHDGYNGMVPAKTLSAYARGGYLLDPFYVACMHEHPPGLWRMSDLAPDSFLSSGFAMSPDIHPCISSTHGGLVEELGYIIPLQAHTAVVFSLMKEENHGPFTELELRRLKTLTPIVTQAFEAHWRLHPEEPGVAPGNPESHLESAFVDILQGQLTDSQRYIAKLFLQGHSNASIAHLLGISEGTVKVHKHNIYQRLQISSNADLFRLFINYISRAPR